ncbi:hypothetical protein [Corallococcus llansteffanensis]|uniref:Uncharacterized protein n=1 Tax=Corallococcus llansteffanensis TaxID=2316731 RepID=A0A3A8Q347_9BACT|nr:hypothetical protein [Corallococcus llansteffanensis]RKH57734.1 hypothetical protein D7V93_18040 [Corallococcus llansteffanensis]
MALALGSLVGACSTGGSIPGPSGADDTQGTLASLGYQQVTLRSFGYWGGSFTWVAPGEALTREQVDALAGLELIPGNADCWEDIQEYELVMVDAAGQERRVVTNERNAGCGTQEMLDYETLKPLLATLQCVGTEQASAQLSGARTVQAGDGCQHGFFSYRDEPPRWVKVAPASEGGPHTFELLHCEGKTTGLELFDEAGAVLLAQSHADGSSASACAKLTHPLEAGQRYSLRVTSQAVSMGGHVNLVVRRD